MAPLRARTELPRVHVLDHPMTQRGDGIRTHRKLLSRVRPWNRLLGVKPRSAITKGPNHWWRSQHPKARPCRPNPIEPPWYVTRMPGGVGGVAPRGVPLSRSSARSRHCPTFLDRRRDSMRPTLEHVCGFAHGRVPEGEAGLDAEELLQRRIDPVRLLLGDEVAAVDAEAAHVVGMVAPHLEDVIAASLPATHPPQHQHRHPDLLREVRTVLYEVDRRAGAVFVAGRADRLRVPEAAQVLVPRRRLDRVLVVQQGAEHMAQEEFGVG